MARSAGFLFYSARREFFPVYQGDVEAFRREIATATLPLFPFSPFLFLLFNRNFQVSSLGVYRRRVISSVPLPICPLVSEIEIDLLRSFAISKMHKISRRIFANYRKYTCRVRGHGTRGERDLSRGKSTRPVARFVLGFFENGESREKMLFHVFDAIFYVESVRHPAQQLIPGLTVAKSLVVSRK